MNDLWSWLILICAVLLSSALVKLLIELQLPTL